MSSPVSTVAGTTFSQCLIWKCSICGHEFKAEDRFFRCSPCQRGEFNACQACVLKEAFSAEGHHPQPCLLDPRDGQVTFLPKPDVSGFKAMVLSARADPSLRFPMQTRKFLARSTIEGLSTDRLESSDSYYQEKNASYAPILNHTIANNYSLYAKLDVGAKDIRLLRLLPGPPEKAITMVLGRFSFPWTQVPFLALSYRWGDLDETRSVGVIHMVNRYQDGGEPKYEQQVLAVTANLEKALRALRRDDQPVWLWIDAICINQGDFQERADQVNIMAEIYARSSSTIVWLETTAEESDSLHHIHAFLSFLKQMQKEDPTADRLPFMIKLVHRARLIINGEQIDHTKLVKKMSKAFENQWFTRVWVLQEIACTTSTVYVLANTPPLALPWNELQMVQNYLVVANRYLKAGVSGLPSPWLEVERCRANRTDRSSEFLPIVDLFAEVSHNFNATDQRDKLFSLLSIARETQDSVRRSSLIRPNYVKSTVQVFIDFTKWCICHHRTLLVLGHATYSDRTSFPAEEERRLPTWALSPQKRFRKGGRVLCDTEEFCTAADTGIDFSLLRDQSTPDSLRLRGYRLLTIVDAEKYYFDIRWDVANELYLRDMASDEFYYGGVHWMWRSVRGPHSKLAKSCEPLPGYDICSGKYLFHEFLLLLTCGGLEKHGYCDHSRGIHKTRRYKPEELYEMFATYWINHGANWADPEMELFCPHVRGLIQPLAGRGDPEAFAEMMTAATRKTLIVMHGRAGLGPPGTRKGDVVVALFGGRTPFILRPRPSMESNEQEWEFIGECFINGFMDGKHVQRKINRQEPSEIFDIR